MIKCTLKNFMELRNINFTQLSKDTGPSQQALTSLANNESTGIQFSTLDTLLNFFNISLDDLFIQTHDSFAVYVSFPDEDSTDVIELCVQYNRTEVVIPYELDYYVNKESLLSIIEFNNISTKETQENFNIAESFNQLLLSVTDDRFNEFGAFLYSEIIEFLKNDYKFETEVRVVFDTTFDFRTAWVSLDSELSPVVYERSEYRKKDDQLYLINFDK